MKILPLLLASIAPLTLHASEHITVHENVELDAAGSGVVMRTLRWPSATRGMVDVEQKLQVNEVGDLEYDFHAQSEATKSFHRSYCAESGLDPFDGEVTFTPEAGGWNCSSIKLHGEGEVGDGAGTSTFPHDRSIDYVTARAPSGNVQAGVNFFGIGYITFQSSQAGSLQGSVQVDNRCKTYYSQHIAAAFSGNHQAGVNCIAYEPRFLTTGMEGCIPRLCGSDRGTISVR